MGYLVCWWLDVVGRLVLVLVPLDQEIFSTVSPSFSICWRASWLVETNQVVGSWPDKIREDIKQKCENSNEKSEHQVIQIQTLINNQLTYQTKSEKTWNRNMNFFQITTAKSKHLKGQLGPCVGNVKFLHRRRSVEALLSSAQLSTRGAKREVENTPKFAWSNWIMAWGSNPRPFRS